MDLHPEDLLECDAAGELGPAERERLEMHLRHCAACRLERRVRDDFQRVDDDFTPDVRALVASALGPERARSHRLRVRSRVARLRFGLVAAALFALTGLAAAAAGWPLLRSALRRPDDSVPRAVSTTVAARFDPHGAAGAPTEPVLDPPEPPAMAISSTPTGAPSPGDPTRAPVSRASPPPLDDVSSLFTAANAARRRGGHEKAAALYRRVIARYPASAEAHESLAVLGRMLLDDGDAAGALESFEAYLSRGGALVAEALLGKALALQRLGRSYEERSAWSALVGAYPDSVHADRARARLRDLEH
jgi:tetratricopeptide (TPR) repeat protein